MQSKDSESKTAAGSSEHVRPTSQQVPDFRGDPTLAQLFEFIIGSTKYIRTAITSLDPLLEGTQYAWDTEYWNSLDSNKDWEKPIAMSVSAARFSAGEIDDFLSGYTAAFNVGQFGASWTQWTSTNQPNAGSLTWYLYQATDPDSGTSPVSIGLAFGINGDGFLQSIVWYKTWNPSYGLVWQSMNAPASLEWSYVGQTTDPSGITPWSGTWYWVQNGSPTTPATR
jgi:hypothetical protein